MAGTEFLTELGFLHCPICLETYEQPKSLPCGHSLCIRCFTQIVQRKPDSNGKNYIDII